jgi:hypothetical protein
VPTITGQPGWAGAGIRLANAQSSRVSSGAGPSVVPTTGQHQSDAEVDGGVPGWVRPQRVRRVSGDRPAIGSCLAVPRRGRLWVLSTCHPLREGPPSFCSGGQGLQDRPWRPSAGNDGSAAPRRSATSSRGDAERLRTVSSHPLFEGGPSSHSTNGLAGSGPIYPSSAWPNLSAAPVDVVHVVTDPGVVAAHRGIHGILQSIRWWLVRRGRSAPACAGSGRCGDVDDAVGVSDRSVRQLPVPVLDADRHWLRCPRSP